MSVANSLVSLVVPQHVMSFPSRIVVIINLSLRKKNLVVSSIAFPSLFTFPTTSPTALVEYNMRVSTVLAALPALAAAQEQIPLLDRFQPYIDRVTEFGRTLAGSPGTGGSKTTPHPAVTELTLENWESTIRNGGKHPAGNIEPWLIYVTGNKTCHGDCLKTDAAWDVRYIFLLSFLPKGFSSKNI